MSTQSSTPDLDNLPPAMPLSTLIAMLLAVALGAFAAAIILPNWLPGLSQSLLSSNLLRRSPMGSGDRSSGIRSNDQSACRPRRASI